MLIRGRVIQNGDMTLKMGWQRRVGERDGWLLTSARGKLVVFISGNIHRDQMWWEGLNETLRSLDFILQWLENQCRSLIKEMTWSWLYLRTISQDGLGKGGDIGCKKIGGLKKRCCMNADIEMLQA